MSVFNANVENLVSDIGIKIQLEKVGSDVDAIMGNLFYLIDYLQYHISSVADTEGLMGLMH